MNGTSYKLNKLFWRVS